MHFETARMMQTTLTHEALARWKKELASLIIHDLTGMRIDQLRFGREWNSQETRIAKVHYNDENLMKYGSFSFCNDVPLIEPQQLKNGTNTSKLSKWVNDHFTRYLPIDVHVNSDAYPDLTILIVDRKRKLARMQCVSACVIILSSKSLFPPDLCKVLAHQVWLTRREQAWAVSDQPKTKK